MTILVFAGPSISKLDTSRYSGIVFLPPAAQGDIYRACRSKPQAIGLIDGYFDGVPSVWHKEILWAMSQGIAVFGSASMGALRAAELDQYGMAGVGTIYGWYRDGLVEDDDEVALLHGPPETHYCALSEPMVNVRATCQAAEAASMLDAAGAKRIIEEAKRIYYKDRSWQVILDRCPEYSTFKNWLELNLVDQKALDATAMIEVLCTFDGGRHSPFPDRFHFEHTNLWENVIAEWAANLTSAVESDLVSKADILDELRLDVLLFRELSDQAILRSLLLIHADDTQVLPERSEKMKILGQLRMRLGLQRKSELDAWARRNNIDDEALEDIVHDETCIDKTRRKHRTAVDDHIIALLKLRDAHSGLAIRSQHKRAILKSLANAGTSNTSLAPPMLLNWFFMEKKTQSLPRDVDSLVDILCLTSRQDFYRLLEDEYVYQLSIHGGRNGDGVV